MIKVIKCSIVPMNRIKKTAAAFALISYTSSSSVAFKGQLATAAFITSKQKKLNGHRIHRMYFTSRLTHKMIRDVFFLTPAQIGSCVATRNRFSHNTADAMAGQRAGAGESGTLPHPFRLTSARILISGSLS